MALIQAEIDLANQALGKIGAKQVTFAEQGSVPGVQINLHFVQTRDSLLRSFLWPFAKTRIRLVGGWVTLTVYTTDQYVWQDDALYKSQTNHTAGTFATDLAAGEWTLISTIDAVAVFGFSYDLPADSLRVNEVNGESPNTHHRRHHHRDWELETNTILSTLNEIDLVYIDKITTTTEWDDLFTEMFINKLALNLIGPLTGVGSGTQGFRKDLVTELRELNKQTRAIGRNEGNNTGGRSWNEARLGGFVGRINHV